MFKRFFVLLVVFLLSFSAYSSSHSSSSSRSRGSSSYSSGKSSFSSSRSSAPSSSSKPSSSGKSYSSGSKSSDSKSTSTSPPKKSFFSRAEKAQAKADSKAKYEAYKAKSYDKSKASSQSYDFLKKQPAGTYKTRSTRERTIFKSYHTAPQPTVVYRDTSWNPFFWMWLLDHQQNQAEWVYHHRDQLSEERYKDLLAKNKDLEQQIKALEEKKITKDPNYSPAGVDKDLMYSDDYVKQVQNDKEQEDSDDTSWIWLLSIVFVPVVVGVSGWIGYQVFFKKRSF